MKMGRPAKVREPLEFSTDNATVVTETMESRGKLAIKELKLCPKCGEKTYGPRKDEQGNWRCNCSHPKCCFWDSMVYNTADEAAAGWEAAGGPERYE